ncbi:MAG: universal stress protein [Cyclobacteriaceae bacterium]|nr:universal stress protein [Cyclobacteriaceae bacterium]
MAKTLVALEENAGFNNNVINICKDLFCDKNENLFVGLLVKDLSYITSLSAYVGEPALVDYMPYDLISDEDRKKAEVISVFEDRIKKAGFKYQIYNDFRLTSRELIKQSTYADLMILSYQAFINKSNKEPDTSLIYQILKGSRCPVIILPMDISNIENIIFTYDGKESSVFAIRAFSNLFSKYTKDKEVSILTVMPSADEEIKNEKLLLDLVQQHYNNVGVQLLEGSNISEEISNFAESVDNPMVVMGAYGRSHISNLLLPSVAKDILKKSSIPLFIAHR